MAAEDASVDRDFNLPLYHVLVLPQVDSQALSRSGLIGKTSSVGPTRSWRIPMSIVVRFVGAPSVTKEKYDETLRRLESEGDFPPDGLDFHVAFGSDGDFRVSEIWDSQEKFEAFGPRLMPILDDVGIELAGEPEVLEVHNIIKR
jgi:hypothetical protein